MLILSSLKKPFIARDLNSQDSSQTIGAIGDRALSYINTAEEKETVPAPWQDFLG